MTITDDDHVAAILKLAKEEDFGRGDLSTRLLEGADTQALFRLIAKQPGVFAGAELAPAVLAQYDDEIKIEWSCHSGPDEPAHVDGTAWDSTPFELATLHGSLGPILSAERVLLNFLQRLSGIATLTRRFVDAVAHTDARILDTRKTTPGWRALEKYAVRCGGGRNHRLGLYDAVLIKDNHLAGIDTPHLAKKAQTLLDRLEEESTEPQLIMIEADSIEQLQQLLQVEGLDVILLDNFSVADLRSAVALRDADGLRGKIGLEASGGITLESVRAVAESGVDRISIGALTHSATAIDLSLERV